MEESTYVDKILLSAIIYENVTLQVDQVGQIIFVWLGVVVI